MPFFHSFLSSSHPSAVNFPAHKVCAYILSVPYAIGNDHLPVGMMLEGRVGGWDVGRKKWEGSVEQTRRRGESPMVVSYSRVGSWKPLFLFKQTLDSAVKSFKYLKSSFYVNKAEHFFRC